MEIVCIDAEAEWETIFAGKLTEDQINSRRTKIRKLQLDIERKHFPEAFEPSLKQIALAGKEAQTYFIVTNTEEASDGDDRLRFKIGTSQPSQLGKSIFPTFKVNIPMPTGTAQPAPQIPSQPGQTSEPRNSKEQK